jgi:hypothetical protein
MSRVEKPLCQKKYVTPRAQRDCPTTYSGSVSTEYVSSVRFKAAGGLGSWRAARVESVLADSALADSARVDSALANSARGDSEFEGVAPSGTDRKPSASGACRPRPLSPERNSCRMYVATSAASSLISTLAAPVPSFSRDSLTDREAGER